MSRVPFRSRLAARPISRPITRWLALVVLGGLLGSCAPIETVERLRVRILYPVGGRGDASVSDNIFAGFIVASAGTNFDVEQVAPDDLFEAEAVLEDWLADRESRQLIISGSSKYAPLIDALNCDFGAAHILQLDAPLPTCAGLRSVAFRTFGPSFLAGVAAVSDPELNPDGTVAVIGGAPTDPVLEQIAGFRAGVEHAGGEVVAVEWVDDNASQGFNDPERAAELTRGLIGRAHVIYAAAGRSGNGVADALDAHADANPEEMMLLIGSDVDHSGRHAQVTLGSVLKRFDYSVRDVILNEVVGLFSPGDVRVGFADRMTEFILHPLRGARVIEGDCDCDPFMPSCAATCTTLEDVVQDEWNAALAAARAYEDE